MMHRISLTILVCARMAAPQETAAPRDLPRFDVASVKPRDSGGPNWMGVRIHPGGRVEISGLSLRNLVGTAFGVGYWQISGGEEWTSNDTYFIEAKPPEGMQASIKGLRHTLFGIDDPVLRQMLQALLIDRFQLKVLRETRTGEVYLLKRNEKPLALKPASIPEGASESDPFGSVGFVSGKWGIFSTTMPQLAKFASDFILHAPVLDRTGLEGAFDYRQRQPELDPEYEGDKTASFKAFLVQAGFKWERSQGPVEMLVIDHAAKPAPN